MLEEKSESAINVTVDIQLDPENVYNEKLNSIIDKAKEVKRLFQ